MFLHLSYSVHRGRGFHDVTSCGTHLGMAPPPPKDGTPLWVAPPLKDGTTPTYGSQAGGTHPTGMLSCNEKLPKYRQYVSMEYK